MPRKPKDTWRRRTRSAAFDYPSLKAAERELREVRITPTFGNEDAHGSFRSTEDAAIAELPPAQQRRLEAVENALRAMSSLNGAEDRQELIQLIYFTGRRYTIDGAAMQIPVSSKTAQSWSNEFLLLVWASLCQGSGKEAKS